MIERHTEARRGRAEGGFTLIELLVVIIILGILAAVVVFAVGGVGDKGNQASCVIDTRTLRTALEANLANQGDYTVDPADWDGTIDGEPTPSDVDEATLVTNGFLSEQSGLHKAQVYDSSDVGGTVKLAITILVEDGDAPGGDCGDADAVVDGVDNF